MSSTTQDIKRSMRTFFKPWYGRPTLWVLALLVVIGALRLAAPSLIARRLNRSLNLAAQETSTSIVVGPLSFFSFPPVMAIEGFSITDSNGVIFQSRRVEVHGRSFWNLLWRDRSLRIRTVTGQVSLTRSPVRVLEALRDHLPTSHIEIISLEEAQIETPEGTVAFRGALRDVRSHRGPAEVEIELKLPSEGRGSWRSRHAKDGAFTATLDIRRWPVSTALNVLSGMEGTDSDAQGHLDLWANVTRPAGSEDYRSSIHSRLSSARFDGDGLTAIKQARERWGLLPRPAATWTKVVGGGTSASFSAAAEPDESLLPRIARSMVYLGWEDALATLAGLSLALPEPDDLATLGGQGLE